MKRNGMLIFVLIIIFSTGCNQAEQKGNLSKNFFLKPTKPQKGEIFIPSPPKGKKWKLVWEDDFSGEKIDESKWEILGDYKRKDGYFYKDNAYLDGKGNLILRVRKDGDKYTSAAVRTRGRYEKRYGYFVARCKLPKTLGKGHWPAWWMTTYGKNNYDRIKEGLKNPWGGMSTGVFQVGSQGKDGTEIDIFEKFWNKGKIQHAMHWDGYNQDHVSVAQRTVIPGIDKGYHTYGLLWTEDGYWFYIDNQLSWQTKLGGVSRVPEFLYLSEEIAKWSGDITENKTLPNYFKVDFVRVYDFVEKD